MRNQALDVGGMQVIRGVLWCHLAAAVGATACGSHPRLTLTASRGVRSTPTARPHEAARAVGAARVAVTDERARARTRVAPPRSAQSGPLAIDATERTAAIADADADAVVVLSVTRSGVSTTRSIATESGPSAVLFDGTETLYVCERRAGSIAAFDARTGALRGRVAVASDPVAMALSPDESTLFVASAMSARAIAIDAASLAIRASVDVSREPRSIAVSVDGRTLFIGHAAGPLLSTIDVAATNMRAEVLPRPQLPTVRAVAEDTLTSGSSAFPERVEFAEGQRPARADTIAIEPASGHVLVAFSSNRTGSRGGGGGYGGSGELIVRPTKTAFAFAVFDPRSRRWIYTDTSDRTTTARSRTDPRVVRLPLAMTLVGRRVTLLSAGTDAIAEFSLPGVSRRRGPREPLDVTLTRTLDTPIGLIATSWGESIVYSQVDHAVEYGPANRRQRLRVGNERLPESIALGRRLFYTADDRRLSLDGLSCAHCHPDGRDDGMTWALGNEVRQTPSLVGRLVAPFSWSGRNSTLTQNIRETIERLGGQGGLRRVEVEALAAYVTEGMFVPAVSHNEPAEVVRRGRELFNGAADCARCHEPSRSFADGERHLVAYSVFDTPSLRFVSRTPPYFHDGRFDSLAVMLASHRARMGRSALLPAEDRAALEAYLRTL